LVEPDARSRSSCTRGVLVLGSTYEVVTLARRHRRRVEGKSSLGRLGLLTHANAGFRGPRLLRARHPRAGQRRHLPIKLYPGMKIGQFCFLPALVAVGASLRVGEVRLALPGQRGPTPSRSFQNFHRTPV